jgi:LPXTG-motif cell wall-anchored protein
MTSRIRNLLLVALMTLALPTGALAQEDTSGADQYTEPGIPGSEAPSEPTEPEPDPAPTAPAPTGSTAPTTAEPIATTAQDETATLPRTGAEGAWIALTALVLLGSGFLLRRVVSHQSA